jgi:NADH-quinone oxidoreductase subunit C
MALQAAIRSVEELRERPALAALLAADPALVAGVCFDRGELTITVPSHLLREACRLLREPEAASFRVLADITCVDLLPAEPRFAMIYSLLSHERHERLRLKSLLHSAHLTIDSLTPLWPGAASFEREVFDLFGVRFQGHPDLRRILLPEDWEGHPLRKDYPVEGYR